MRSAGNNNNNSVVIETPNSTGGTPRPRRTQSVTPVRLFPRASTSGRRRYDSNNENSFIRNVTENIQPRRLFNNNEPGPSSPGRKPRKIDVSKYEKMLKNMNTNNKKVKNNKPNNENKNVVAWLNSGMGEANKSNIPKNKRVFILPDITNNGKIKHVWDRRFLNGLIESAETLPVSRRREVRENNDPSFTSPLTRIKFSKNDIKAYPPTNATKNIIKRFVQTRSLESELNNIQFRDRDVREKHRVIDKIKLGIRSGTISTKEQIKDLALIYRGVGIEMFTTGHNPRNIVKFGSYYRRYIEGKFKSHHLQFIKKAPNVVLLLYDKKMGGGKENDTPLYKLPTAVTQYLTSLEPHVQERKQTRTFNNITYAVMRVMKKIISSSSLNRNKNNIMNDISKVKNIKLRNNLRNYVEWGEVARNAAS